MEKTYQPAQIEAYWQLQWEKDGSFSPSGQGDAYCIMIPPPNVTGSLHMGHGFESTLIDCVIRYQRSLGKNTLWQVGTDHSSPTRTLPCSTVVGARFGRPGQLCNFVLVRTRFV